MCPTYTNLTSNGQNLMLFTDNNVQYIEIDIKTTMIATKQILNYTVSNVNAKVMYIRTYQETKTYLMVLDYS